MLRVSILLTALVFSASIHAELRLGEPQVIGNTRRSAAPIWASDFRAVSTSWGYVAVWIESGRLRMTRLDKTGRVLDDPAALVAADFALMTAHMATDGTDVMLAYTHSGFGGRQNKLVRITPDGEVMTARALPNPPSAIVWTGSSYLVYVGSCGPVETLQLDREGAVIQSFAMRFPVRNCDPMAPLIYRDSTGVFRLIYQVTGLDLLNHVWRFTLTDEQGEPIRNGLNEPMSDELSGNHFRAAITHGDGFYLVANDFVQLVDRDGNPAAPRIAFEGTTMLHAAPAGDGLIVTGVTAPDQAKLLTWHVAHDGTTTPLFTNQPGSTRRQPVAIYATPTGATAFTIEVDSTRRYGVPSVSFIRYEERGSRMRRTLPLALGVPDQRQLTGAAHGDGMIAAWTQPNPASEIFFTILDSSARPVVRPRLLMPGTVPQVASSGEIAMVAAQTAEGVTVTRVDRDGVVLDREPMLFKSLQLRGLVWDGSAFVVQAAPMLALRIDEFGRLLTPDPVALAGDPRVFNVRLGVSPRGLVAFYAKERVPGDPITQAVFAQALTRDLQPIGAPELISIMAPDGPFDVVWTGSHFDVAFASAGALRATRVSGEGKPLEGDLPRYAGLAEYLLRLGRVDGQTIAVTPFGLMQLGGGVEASSVTMGQVSEAGPLVTTRDGRSWLLYMQVAFESATTPVSQPYARELFVD